MTFLKNLAIGLFAVVAILIAAGFALPNTAHLERSITVDARPSTVFTVLNSYKLFNQWSPWAELDPNAVYMTAGPESGVGAKQAWDSEDPDVGSGSQEIIESTPYTMIKQALVFNDFDTDNTASYTLTSAGEGTQVIWSYDTSFKGSLLFRYFGLMLDKMIGPDYEKGLAKLKLLVESLPKADFTTLKVETVDLKPMTIAYTAASTVNDTQAIGDALGEAYAKQISEFISTNKLTQIDAPIAIYDACDNGNPSCAFRPGIPVDRDDVEVAEDSAVKLGQTAAGKALKVVHTGPYANLPATHDMLHAYMAASGIETNGPVIEHYVSDASTTPEAELITEIYIPVK